MDQIISLQQFLQQYPSGKLVNTCALYKGFWNAGGGIGISYIGSYGYSNSYSCSIVSDVSPNIWAHESGHNMGAMHATTIDDVMFPVALPNQFFHLNAANLFRIRRNLGIQ